MNEEANLKFFLEGSGGKLKVYSDKIVIIRKGLFSFMNHGLKGDKTIFFNQISGIQIKLSGVFLGYLQFSIPGGNESSKGIMDATKDENTIMFVKKDNDLANKIKDFIEQSITEKSSSENNISGADEILKYKNLLEQGIISQEEFNKKKKDILGI